MKHITDLTAAAAEAKHADYKPVNVYMYAGITIIENIHKQMHVRRSLQSLYLPEIQFTTYDCRSSNIFNLLSHVNKENYKAKKPKII